MIKDERKLLNFVGKYSGVVENVIHNPNNKKPILKNFYLCKKKKLLCPRKKGSFYLFLNKKKMQNAMVVGMGMGMEIVLYYYSYYIEIRIK